MRFATLVSAAVSLASVVALQGCAGHAADEGASADAVTASPTVTGAAAANLMTALTTLNAPSDTPAGMLGVGSRIARIELTTAQGGFAHYISQSGELSAVDGSDLGNALESGVAWKDLGDALVAGGAQWVKTEGQNGASSSTIFAKVRCQQVVSPTAKPSCAVTPITMSEAEAKTLMTLLQNVDAPSATPAGVLGVGSRTGRVTLTTAQGGMAHFISQSLAVTNAEGKTLGDIASSGVAFEDVKSALLDGSAIWKTTQGAAGASSSTMVADVTCSQVVAPAAKPTCTVRPYYGE